MLMLVKKFWGFGFAVLFFLFTCSGFGFAEEKKDKTRKKLRFELVINNLHSTSFDPDNMNLSMDNTLGWSDASYMLYQLILGSHYYQEVRVCIYANEPIAQGKALAQGFDYQVGDIFPVSMERQFTLSRAEIPFKVGVEIPVQFLLNNLSVQVDYYQGRGIRLEQFGDLDYFSIETLEETPVGNGYSWWEMDLNRTYKKRESTLSFSNSMLNIILKYDLLAKSEKFSFYPEIGVSLSFLKRRLSGDIEMYRYITTLFPGIVYPEQELDNFRELDNTIVLGETSTKLKPRFLVGVNAEFRPWDFLGFSYNVRLFHNAIKETYQESFFNEEFPLVLKLSPFVVSVGVSIFF